MLPHMELFFLRHAKAAPKTGRSPQRDAERPLTPDGVAKMRLVAKGIQRLGLQFDRILSSPYVRARQTAEIAAEVLRLASELTFTPHLAPDGDARALVAELNQQRRTLGRVVLVGHEPYLSSLMSVLIGGRARVRMNLRKAGLALVSSAALRYGQCATLEWLMSPRQLALLSKA